jgi:hypothetical protein
LSTIRHSRLVPCTPSLAGSIGGGIGYFISRKTLCPTEAIVTQAGHTHQPPVPSPACPHVHGVAKPRRPPSKRRMAHCSGWPSWHGLSPDSLSVVHDHVGVRRLTTAHLLLGQVVPVINSAPPFAVIPAMSWPFALRFSGGRSTPVFPGVPAPAWKPPRRSRRGIHRFAGLACAPCRYPTPPGTVRSMLATSRQVGSAGQKQQGRPQTADESMGARLGAAACGSPVGMDAK